MSEWARVVKLKLVNVSAVHVEFRRAPGVVRRLGVRNLRGFDGGACFLSRVGSEVHRVDPSPGRGQCAGASHCFLVVAGVHCGCDDGVCGDAS